MATTTFVNDILDPARVVFLNIKVLCGMLVVVILVGSSSCALVCSSSKTSVNAIVLYASSIGKFRRVQCLWSPLECVIGHEDALVVLIIILR